jgi:hypothetical protein
LTGVQRPSKGSGGITIVNRKAYVPASALIIALALPGGLAQASDAVLATEALSPSIRALLISEMQALANAMARIHRAMVLGDHRTVAAEAKAVHDSFVLARELSESQRQEIRTKLPPAFVSADQAFHELSARLIEASSQEDVRLERLWFDEMTRACLDCHRTFAGKRFVGLTQGNGTPEAAVTPDTRSR